ncbi:TetR/AcrR family transcriptional regulator [Streptomyces sp. NBC_01283]|uniref:ScbR family autoregulator-binding transcription factor n=1 Tax=Streptomyces sp. NBC_01283 TaxID=2903812 RepID=UPI00352C2CC0|nr:TetR/AcrR family transcriptional regulator [Streptomyces sp. NBC_01283]WSL21347.1 TetR/AcrR family transcriptional regulator [Streptomyces sp. NBC_01283]
MAQQERALRTRRAILTAAAEVFDDFGYEAATMSQILRRAGVTKGALYFHFTSKEQLASEVLHENAQVPAVPPQRLKLQEAADRGLLLAYLMVRDPVLRGGVRLALEQVGQDRLERNVPFLDWAEESLRLLQLAKSAGELQPHIDPGELSEVFVGAFAGTQLMSHALSGRADLNERVVALYRVLLAGIAAPGVMAELDVTECRGARVEKAIRALHPSVRSQSA